MGPQRGKHQQARERRRSIVDKQHKPGEQQHSDHGAGPEEVWRSGRAIPDADDAEGHGFRGNATPDADDEAASPQVIRPRGVDPDAD